MASYGYQYGTSPRKVEPEVRTPKKAPKKVANSKNTKNKKTTKATTSKKQKDKAKSKELRTVKTNITILMMVFLGSILLIMYRNVKIRESYAGVQELNKQIASLEKENSQISVQIQNSLNLNNIEEMASASLGMQKLSNKQTVYISLDTKGYTEISQKSLTKEKKTNFFKMIIDKIVDFF